MSGGRGSYLIPVIVCFAALLFGVPASAYTVAMYGSNAGFDPALHPGTVSVLKAIPGSSGADLDSAVNQFTDPSVDVIILGGEATFSPSTAAKIEAAVAGGKVLVVTYPCIELFDQSLPATNGGTTTGGQFLEVSAPNSAASKVIFASLPARYDLVGSPPDREQAIANAGTMTVLNFDSGMPALLYGKYGKGYVIEWTTVPVPSYMNGATADTIVHRMILGLLPEPAPTQTPVITTRPATLPLTQLPTTVVSPAPTISSSAGGETGDVTIYSSPAGASIQIDGIYFGTTRGTDIGVKITGVPAGTHLLRLSMSGFSDYQATNTIVAGQTNTWYGTLQPLTQQMTPVPTTTAAPTTTAIPTATPVPTATESAGILQNSSVVVALIGVITALIAAGASIFTHIRPPPPPRKE